MKSNPLLDKQFLKAIDLENQKELSVRIVSLNIKEEPIETIEGKVSQGNLSIDGNSAVRRTCSLTLVANEVNINEYYWGLTNKFKLYIGLKNTIDPDYDEIIWYPQGVYVITEFKTQQMTSNFQIYITGKDKMCMLNGELGGELPHATQIDVIEEWDENDIKTEIRLPVKQAITELIHKFGNEPFHNIILNDMDETGLAYMEFNGKHPMYLFKRLDEEGGAIEQITFDGDIAWYDRGSGIFRKINTLATDEYYSLSPQANNLHCKTFSPTRNYTDTIYEIIKCEPGEAAGYRRQELVYPSKEGLIADCGSTITSVLDEFIKSLFNTFEYFYDVDGHFVFQKKLNYINTSWNNLIQHEDDEQYAESAKTVSQTIYDFSNQVLISSYSNVPDFQKIKNDFAVWGKRRSVLNDTEENSIHLRFAIDEKPDFYQSYDGNIYTTVPVNFFEKKPNDSGVDEDWWDVQDWAEYYKAQTGEYPTGTIGKYCQGSTYIDLNSLYDPGRHGPWVKDWEHTAIYIFDIQENGCLGYTGHRAGCSHTYDYFLKLYETGQRAYIYKPTIPADIDVKYHIVDWREIIYQMGLDYLAHNHDDDFELQISRNNYLKYPTGRTGYEQYYIDLVKFWRLLYDPTTTDDKTYFLGELDKSLEQYRYWNKLIIEDPASLIFWFDFLDPEGGELGQFSVKAIGDRSKVVNNDKVKAIIYKEVPSIIYGTEPLEDTSRFLDDSTGYTYICLPDVYNDYFDNLKRNKSAWDILDELLYEYGYQNESISITAIPIYHLEPNTRIHVSDRNSGIEGDYIVNKISTGLNHNGTMNISATRVPARLY